VPDLVKVASRQRFSFRQTCRMTLFIDSMIFVLTNKRYCSGGGPSWTMVRISSRLRKKRRDKSGCFSSKHRARLRIRGSALSASNSQVRFNGWHTAA
jgi:hypothetical protein